MRKGAHDFQKIACGAGSAHTLRVRRHGSAKTSQILALKNVINMKTTKNRKRDTQALKGKLQLQTRNSVELSERENP